MVVSSNLPGQRDLPSLEAPQIHPAGIRRPTRRHALVATLLYAVVVAAVLVAFDLATYGLTGARSDLTGYVLRGASFIGVTAGLLHIIIARFMGAAAEREHCLSLALAESYENTLAGWSRALDLRDRETEGHSARVTDLTVRLAAMMGMEGEELEHLRRGAMLHDIGKLGVPDAILHKPGPLGDDEWAVMRRHPEYAYSLLEPIPFLRPVLDIPYCHHERWDGSGYPRGLAGEAIPLAARIFAVVDVWDALVSDRPYRPAWPPKQVVAYLRTHAGDLFDPHVVAAFLELLEYERPARHRLSA